MTSYEIVRRAIEFDSPERLPLRFTSMGIDDTFGVPLQVGTGWKSENNDTDEWGCQWQRPDPASGITNMGQPKGHPLQRIEDMDQVPWPDPTDDHRYAAIEEALAGAGDKYVVTGLGFTLFERMHYLLGMDNLFVAMYEQPALVHELAERVLAFPVGLARELGRRFGGRIHGFGMTDDWGTQQSTFIQMPMWREFFKDRYTRLFAAQHDAGMHSWMHSCGHVNEVIGEWIDCKLDVVNLQQPRNLGIEEIGARYAGKICFETTCDIQMTLPWKNPEAIREEAALLYKHWSTPTGGFILSDYGDGNAIGVPLEKKRIMLEAFRDLAAPGLEIPESIEA
ncbi:MAG TPA: uroporphyrinogen decarboxylase family protein [Armatimonadota bacterium]|jgi:uroporphyrinogen-III decarboxylase